MRKKLFILFAGLNLGVIWSCSEPGFPVPPATTVPKFTVSLDNNELAPATATFTNISIIPERAGEVSYFWTFGDGTPSSTQVNPIHLYESPGVYTVKLLLVTTGSAEIVESSQRVVIKDPNVAGLPVFFTDGSAVFTALINGDAPIANSIKITSLENSYGIVMDTVNQKLYMADYGADKILVANADGTDLKDFRTNIGSPTSVALDYAAKQLYWDTDEGIRRTSLLNTDLGNYEDFVTGQANDPEGVFVDPITQFVFWNNYDGGVWKRHIDGSGQAQIAAGEGGGSIIVIGNRVFFDEYIADSDIRLKSANLDGSGVVTVATGITSLLYGLAYDPQAKKIYWCDRGGEKISRANLNGSNVETWISEMTTRGITMGKRKL